MREVNLPYYKTLNMEISYITSYNRLVTNSTNLQMCTLHCVSVIELQSSNSMTCSSIRNYITVFRAGLSSSVNSSLTRSSSPLVSVSPIFFSSIRALPAFVNSYRTVSARSSKFDLNSGQIQRKLSHCSNGSSTPLVFLFPWSVLPANAIFQIENSKYLFINNQCLLIKTLV